MITLHEQNMPEQDRPHPIRSSTRIELD